MMQSGSHALLGLMDAHALIINSTGARALTKGDDLVKPARVAANSTKVLCVSKEIIFVLIGDRDPHCHNPIILVPTRSNNVNRSFHQ